MRSHSRVGIGVGMGRTYREPSVPSYRQGPARFVSSVRPIGFLV